MNKQDLIVKVMNSTKAPITKADAERALNAVLNGIKDALADGESVQLVGFGTFDVRQRSARTAFNPKDRNVVINVPAKKVPGFKPGKAFKDAVNK